MSRPFTVAALAVAEGPADAVGVVQLACDDDSLALTLLRAGAYRRGFVPGTLAESVTLHIPYGAVRGLVRRGHALILSLDRSVPSPFHRFALARFTSDPAETLAPIHRAHRLASTLAWAVPGPVGALVSALPAGDLVGGALGRASLALLVALLVGVGMRIVAAWLAWGGPVSDRLREAFEEAMSVRLGLVHVAPPPQPPPRRSRRPIPGGGAPSALPAPFPAAPRLPTHLPPPPPDLHIEPERLPTLLWGRILGFSGLAALGVVLVLVFLHRYGTTRRPPAPELSTTIAVSRAEKPPAPPEPPAPEIPREERCFCERADSTLWKNGVEVLQVITTPGPESPAAPPEPKPDDHGDPVFAYDVAIVNNADKRIRETRVVLTYARRDDQNKRVGVTDRGLYWGLPLAPGASVKWTTEGPGTEVRIDKSELGTLAEKGLEPAPADAFFALTRKKHRVVRLHAAVMLAYLRDRRVPEALSALGAPLAPEAPVVKRIRAAAEPLIACELKVEEGQLSLCVFNGSESTFSSAAVKEVVDGDDSAARVWPLPVVVPIHDGVRRSWPLEGPPPTDLVVNVGE